MAAVTTDPARELTLYFRIDRDGLFTIACRNADGSAFDLTGYSPVVNFKNRKGDSANVLQLEDGDGLTIVDGDIAGAVTKAQAALFREQAYYWEMVITQDSMERNWLTGDAIFHLGKFDGLEPNSATITITDGASVITLSISNAVIGESVGAGYFFDITDYGAVGDGSTDDRAAIQAAVDAAGVVGGVVLIPGTADSFYISDSITLNHSMRFMGITPVGGTFDFNFGPYYGPIQPTSTIKTASNKDGFVIEQISGSEQKPVITFDSLNFITAGVYTTANTGAYITAGNMNQSLMITNCSFKGGYRQVKLTSAFYFSIKNNKFVNPFYNCLYITNTIRPDTADSNVSENTFTAGFDLGSLPKRAIEWVNGGGVRFVANKFDTMGFQAPYSMDHAFEYCIHCTNPLGNTGALQFIGNSLENFKYSAFYFYFDYYLIRTIIITDNQTSLGTGPAIDMLGGEHVIIANNSFNGNSSGPAIRLNSVSSVSVGVNTILGYGSGLTMTNCSNILSAFDPYEKTMAIGCAPVASAVAKMKLHGGAAASYQRFVNDATGQGSSDGALMGVDADGNVWIKNYKAASSLNIHTLNSDTPINLYVGDQLRLQVTNLGITSSLPIYAPSFNVVSGGFTPDDLSPFAWWDNGTDYMAADGSLWEDKMLNYDLATIGTPPTFTPNAQNGLPSFAFNGTNDILQGAKITELSGVSSFVIWMVSKRGVLVHESEAGVPLNFRVNLIQLDDDDAFYAVVANGSLAFGTCAGSNIFNCAVLVFDGGQTGNANRLKLYVNGVQQTLSFTGTVPATTDSQSDATIRMGKFADATFNSGEVLEAGIAETITSQQLIDINAYMVNKYAL
jgi:hypothetical protein